MNQNVPQVAAAAAAAAAASVDPLRACLTVCGLDAAQQNAIVLEGFNTLDDFSLMRPKHITDMVKRICSLSVNRGGVRIGQLQIRKLEGLLYWTFDCRRRNLPLDYCEFTAAKVGECISQLEIDEEAEDIDDSVKPPSKLQTTIAGWVQWELSFMNYLQGVKGVQKVPLTYVIRKDIPNDYTHPNEQSELMYQIPLNGPLFDADNASVYRILKSCITGTDAWEWLKEFDQKQDGRLSMQQLRLHYDGPSAVGKRIAMANQQIKELHYKSEQAFPFETFITKLNGAYQALADNGEAKNYWNQS